MRFGILATAAAALLTISPAGAATVVKTAQYGALEGSTLTVADSRFDTSLGTLNRIDILFNVTSQIYFNYSSFDGANNPVASTFTLPQSAATFIDFLRPQTFAFLIAYDQPLDRTVSGRGSFLATATGVYSDYVIGNFTGFLNNGRPTTLTANTYQLSDSKVQSGPGRIEVSDVGNFITARLTYDYTPFASSVPEPATWAMMMLGIAAVGFSLRRRRESASALPATC